MSSLRIVLATFVLAFLAPVALHALWWLSHDDAVAWHEADWSSARLLPAALSHPEPLINVYAARAGRWKGIFAHHCWIVIKERGAANYTRYDKVAWGQPVKVNAWAPDARWYGHQPVLVGAVEGAAAEALIAKVRAAVAAYPHNVPGGYRVWPGPNSNSFAAYLVAAIPEARIALPPTAIGKDFHGGIAVVALSPSRTGIELSLAGLVGITLGWVEGVELNVLGLVLGLDLRRPALKIPGFGRIGSGPVLD